MDLMIAVFALPRKPWHGIFCRMSTVEEIKTAIRMLSLEERAEIAAELCGWTDDDWDRQMKADGASGKFDTLNREADEAHASGRTRPLDDIIREP